MGMDLKNFVGKRVHFIGAGGCSMSGLARLMQQLGMEVTGSDRTASHKTRGARAGGHPRADRARGRSGAPGESGGVFRRHRAGQPRARRGAGTGYPPNRASGATWLLCREHVCPIGVSGTHGKTTVTAMIAQVMCENALNPTVHVGGELDAIGGSTRLGGREYFLCEACEFNRGRSSNSSPKSP